MTQVNTGCRHYPDCFTCPFPDCILAARDGYRTKTTISVDQDQLNDVKWIKPKCVVPDCQREGKYWAWNDGERRLDVFCDDEKHRGYADHHYYNERGMI